MLTNSALFPGYWRDIAGNKVNMTAAQFTAIAVAALGVVKAISDAVATAAGGGGWTAPSTAVTIA